LCLLGRLAYAVVVVAGVFVAVGCAGDAAGPSPTSAVTPTEAGAGPVDTVSTGSPASSPKPSTPAQSVASAPDILPATSSIAPVTITVLYDNIAVSQGTRADWGFSCLIRGFEKTVLFDTGARGDVLLHNMEVLGIAPQEIEVVVLSHDHSDHTGGLAQVVAQNAHVAVYYPASFARDSVASARDAGATLVPVEAAVSPCPGVTVMAPFGKPQESGLMLETAAGRVLVVGCAHPGVVEMVEAAGAGGGGPVVAVVGGFHLRSHSAEQVDRIARDLLALGVRQCGPAHCTGERAIAQLTAAFAGGATGMGVGAVVTF